MLFVVSETVVYLLLGEVLFDVLLQVGEDLEVLGLVLKDLEDGVLLPDTQSAPALPAAIGIRHELEPHLIPDGLQILKHLLIHEQLRVIREPILEHGEHHACQPCDGFGGGFGEEVPGAFLEFHLVVGDESLVGGRHVDDVLVVAGLLLDRDQDARDLLREVILDQLVDDAHL